MPTLSFEVRDRSPSSSDLRVDDRLEVDLSIDDEARLFGGLEGDIAGLFVPTYRRWTIGRAVEIDIDLGSERLRARGVVRFVREAGEESAPGIGVVLSEASDETRERLASFGRDVGVWYYDADI